VAALRSTYRSPNRLLQRRADLLLLALILAFGVVVTRLVWLQWWQRGQFERLAAMMYDRTNPIPARRGPILARAGEELASNVEARDLFGNPRVVKDPAATARSLAELFGGDAEEYRRRLTASPRSAFAYLKRGIDRERAEARRKELQARPELKGIDMRPSPRRAYPGRHLAAALLGHVDPDGRGIDGLELLYNATLSGKDGYVSAQVDAKGDVIPGTERDHADPVDGREISLTLDPTIQEFAERELQTAVEHYQAESASAIVMDPRSGEVLALANAPGFDPAHPEQVGAENRKCRAVVDTFEPGSIFKLITAAAALEERVDTNAYCPGVKVIGPHRLRCAKHHVHGQCDLARMLEQSCNISAGTIAQRIGPERLFGHIRDFGFLEKTGVGALGETRGFFSRWEDWKPVDTYVIGYGQSITVTAMQMIRAYAAIANDGLMIRPRLLASIARHPVENKEPMRRVVTSETARTLREYLTRVVTAGTGKSAKIPHYSVAGKTGTAQVAEGGAYRGYVASFIGFVPATRPRLAILVAVRKPRNGQYGGMVAAPAFREIARQSMSYLRVPPDAPGDERDGARSADIARWKRLGEAVEGPLD
jgi:cell division protein FtsI/penicillin-binding protein 2